MAMNDNMSFLPEDYIEKRIEKRTMIICMSLFVVVFVGVIGAYFMSVQERDEVTVERGHVNKAFADAATALKDLETLQQEKMKMLEKASVTSTLIEPVPRTFLFADLINRMPKTLSLLEFAMETKVERRRVVVNKKKAAIKNKANAAKATPKTMTVPKSTVKIELTGVAPSDKEVAAYIARLSQSKLLREVSLVFSEESKIQDRVMRKFRVAMMLDSVADVRDLEVMTKPRLKRRNPLRVRGGGQVTSADLKN